MSRVDTGSSWRVAGLAAFAVLGTVALIVAIVFVAAAFVFSRA